MSTPFNQPSPPKQTNYLPWILGGCGLLLFVGIIFAGVAGVVFYSLTPSQGNGKRIGFPGASVKTVDNNGVQTVAKNWSSCSAFAPADWTIIGNEQRIAIGVDLTAADKSMSASYGVAGVTGGAFYGMATPEDYIQTMMENNGTSGFAFDGAPQSVQGYTLRYWRGQSSDRPMRGFVLYQAFNTNDPNTYIMALRMGSTDAAKWDQNKNIAYDVAASIRCTKHLFPAQENSTREPKGSSKDDIEREMSRKRQEATMGFQNVYSPSTGEHWEASYSDYNATGPDGPGYYRRVGNSYEKLNEGFPPN
ncbi:MAG TPA: hypothetical protein VE961_05740 [Pyrinomonadaceae bacterium]|nr:hypothetical protein [Pyrinomonadaceae bacterium]